MVDVFSKEKRSEVMSRIRGKGNLTTEMKMADLFRRHRITGWRRHVNLPGRPDFVFPRAKIAVFVDGCFWHGCPRCFRAPAANSEFWSAKIEANKRRDRRVARGLRARGWSVVRIRECSLKRRGHAEVRRIERLFARRERLNQPS
jgi:DNA mismatch endonuclease (patch repair protein)